MKTNGICPISDYLALQGVTEMEKTMFYNKVCKEKEIKLKEYNFKMLHGILPCNRNLKRWKIKESDKCDLCSNTQSIEHLLYQCAYVKPIWNIVNNVFNINVTYDLILGKDEIIYNSILTIVSFLIYKQWLLQSLNNQPREKSTIIPIIKNELQLREAIYKQCPCISEHITGLLEQLIKHL